MNPVSLTTVVLPARKVVQGHAGKQSIKLFRDIAKEVPRCLQIFDIDIPPKVIRSRIADMIRKNGHVEDNRVVAMLVQKGYLELEETCLQYKTRHQLLQKIDPPPLDVKDDFVTQMMKSKEKMSIS
uniref:NADH dehydrogenase [ubiquinone] 1 alpha subcomplex subunit 6 n=1 Tax=Octactis speculum TaxID=3111310 RepID=A0A7S2GK57_9STRA